MDGVVKADFSGAKREALQDASLIGGRVIDVVVLLLDGGYA